MSKRLTIYEDNTLPAGSVVVAVTQADGVDAGRLTLSVARRNADRPYLGAHGWQPSEHGFSPLQVLGGEDDLIRMVFGSELTRHLGEDMSVTLSVAALGISEKHFWPGISAEPEDGGLNLQHAKRQPAALTKQVAGLAATAPDPQAGEDVTGAIADLPPDAPPRKPKWPLAAAALLLLIAAGAGAGYFFWDRQDGQVAMESPPEPTPPAPVSDPAPEGPDFQARYRDYLAQQGQAEALLALGNEALAANVVEVGFNAITLSADRGLPAAKLVLGEWYDPLVEQRGPVRPNPNSAAVYYGEAAALGSQEASAAMQRLCQAAAASPAPEWSENFDVRTHCP